jgi:hypothetical protein
LLAGVSDEETHRMSAQPADAPPGLLAVAAERPLTVDDLFEDETPGRQEAGLNVVAGPRTLVIPDIGVGAAGSGLSLRPDELVLVVEIASPSTRRRDLVLKRELYREWKVPFVIVDRGQEPAVVVVEGDVPDWVGQLSV